MSISVRTGDENELNERVSELEYKIRNLMDKHAPVKVFKVDPQKVNWLSDDLKEKIAARNEMRRKLDKYGGDNGQWRKWKSLRNKVNKEIKNAKMEFMKKRIQHKMENSKTLWEGVKSFLGWKGGGSPDIVVDNGVKVSMPEKIVMLSRG